MDDPLLVRGFERLGNLRRDRQRLTDRDRRGRDPIGERRAIDQLHDQCVQRRPALFEAIDLRDVRMIEDGEQLRFATEPREAVGIVGNGGSRTLIATRRFSFVSRAL